MHSLEPFSARDVDEVARLMERYADLGIGLADTSVVVLASRYDTLDVVALDQRRFRALRGPRDLSFRLLPADSV